MADENENKGFTPITTQEQLNTIIADRIKRAEAKAVEPFADYEDIKAKAAKYDEGQDAAKSVETKAAEQIAAMQKQIDGLTGKLTESESTALKARIQAKHKISDEDAALFLTATDSEALETQAKTLAERFADRKRQAPYVPEQTDTDTPTPKDEDGFGAFVSGMRE